MATRGRRDDGQQRPARRRGHAESGRVQRRAALQDDVAGAQILAAPAHVIALGGDRLRQLHDVAVARGLLLHDDGVGAGRNGRAGHDAVGLAGGQRSRRHVAGGDVADDAQPRAAGAVDGAQRIAVHGRVVVRRDVAGGDDVLGQHAAERVGQHHPLGAERPHRRQRQRLRFFDAEQPLTGAHVTDSNGAGRARRLI
jgi:hypothetical protein